MTRLLTMPLRPGETLAKTLIVNPTGKSATRFRER